ncbi:MAG: siderophore biosynthesis protein [Verrucomicrobiales bacterium]|nr:siderophore biosynthesis protein [Verrucomicrobiales bacterium]|tara:strand:- start:2972 stop:3538 length:567 start_codon:yes stop_codon:yes gene_type:complete
MNAPAKNSVEIWKHFHWTFFVHVQGLIISLGRFRSRLNDRDLESARTELLTAADLLCASGAAMELAGNFSRQDYEQVVRPSMMPPAVSRENFSGLMSWDHATLIELWQELRPLFKNLPTELEAAHRDFVEAYQFLATSHRAVCERFGGGESGSLRNGEELGVDVLDLFQKSRNRLIDPNQTSGCPVHA